MSGRVFLCSGYLFWLFLQFFNWIFETCNSVVFFFILYLFESGNLTEIPLTDEYDNASSSTVQQISAGTSYLLDLMLYGGTIYILRYGEHVYILHYGEKKIHFALWRTFLYLTLWRNFYIFIRYGENFYILRYGEKI